jgi:C-1 hydroxylase
MSVEENKELIRRIVKYWNERNLDAFYCFLAPEYVEHLPSGNVTKEQLKKYTSTFFNAFPDIRFTIMDMVAENEKVAVLVNWKATHKGEYLNIPATGKRIDVNVSMIIKIKDGRWVEFWNVTDISLAKQLGFIP